VTPKCYPFQDLAKEIDDKQFELYKKVAYSLRYETMYLPRLAEGEKYQIILNNQKNDKQWKSKQKQNLYGTIVEDEDETQ
jgi:hypothetical protein